MKILPGERLIDFPPGSGDNRLGEDEIPAASGWVSYCLFIRVPAGLTVKIGRLGDFTFPAGRYVYTGSAKRNLRARVNRHLRREKRWRWHIDYLLAGAGVTVESVLLSACSECELAARCGGEIVVSGFGSSDCRSGCGSHLRRLV